MSQPCPRCQRVLDLPGPAAFCPYCGQALGITTPHIEHEGATLPVAPTPSEQLDRLGEYRLVRRLGQGGMGVVYEGEHETTKRRVAVKLVDVQASDDALTRFRQEGKLASAISHPRCVFVLAAEQDKGRPFIVLELMPGKTLDDLVRERGPLSVAKAIGYTLDLIEGLEQVHALGVIHRDVKPSNAFLDADGRVKVGDFGLARSLQPEAKLTRTGTFVGTPLFAAPEQIKGETLDARADVYAVCATLYFLLTGKAPHDSKEGDSLAVLARVVSDDAPLVRARRKELPAGLERILAKGLARDRAGRYPDLASLREELKAFRPRPGNWRLPLARFAAYFIDVLPGAPIVWLLTAFVHGAESVFTTPPGPSIQLPSLLVLFLYFWLCEGFLGYTVGKRLLGLRVWSDGDVGPPGLGRAFVRTLAYVGLLSLPAIVTAAILPLDPTNLLPSLVQSLVGLAGIGVFLFPLLTHHGYRCMNDLLSGTRVVVAPERRQQVRYPSRPSRSEVIPLPQCQQIGPFRVEGEVLAQEGRILRGIDPGLERPVWLWLRPISRPAVPLTRRDSFTGDRPRWLASGEEGEQRWDCFLVPTGAPLRDAIEKTGKRSWEEARTTLHELAARLTERPPEGAPASVESLSQVWLSPEGRLLLIDLPICQEAAASAEDLLAEAAVVLLEGRQRDANLDRQPGGRMPGHARQLLAGLPRFGGTLGATTFRDRLAETMEKPAQLSRATRMLHLGILVMIQCVCGGFFFAAPLFLGFFGFIQADTDLDMGKRTLEKFDRYRATQSASLAAPSLTPLSRLVPAYELGLLPHGQSHRPQLEQGIARFQPYRDARYSRVWGPLRMGVEEGKRNVQHRPEQISATALGWEIQYQAKQLAKPLPSARPGVPVVLVMFAIPLGICVLFAFLFRGGLRYLLLGVEIVRSDGRPAGRFRCAWRTLAAWVPILVVIGLAPWLEEMYWEQWTPGGGPTWMLTLSDVCRVGAVVLVLVWIAACIVTPQQAPHDRLSGTYLVPR